MWFNDEDISDKKFSRRPNIREKYDARSKCLDFIEKTILFFTKLLCSVMGVLVRLGMNRWLPVGTLFYDPGQPIRLISEIILNKSAKSQMSLPG